MKITRFIIEYKDTPWQECKYIDEINRMFRIKLYTDGGEQLNYERIISSDDFYPLLDKLFDDAKFQIKNLLKETKDE